MNLHVNEDFLQLDYQNDMKRYDASTYFEEEGSEPFDANSRPQTIIMMQRIGKELALDTYSLKKLEIFLRTELPFFAVTRRLVLDWVTKNFLY